MPQNILKQLKRKVDAMRKVQEKGKTLGARSKGETGKEKEEK